MEVSIGWSWADKIMVILAGVILILLIYVAARVE